MTRVVRLGAFIVGTLAILATGVFIIGSKEYLFRSTYQLKAQFDNVAGLADGADVQVGGVHSGMVQGIELPLDLDGFLLVLGMASAALGHGCRRCAMARAWPLQTMDTSGRWLAFLRRK